MPKSTTALFADPGSVLSFRTIPLYAVSPQTTGRYGAAVVIGRTAHVVALAPLSEVWTEPPSLAAAAAAATITRGKRGRAGSTEVVTIYKGEDYDVLPELTLLGRREVTDIEARLADSAMAGGYWGIVHCTPKSLSDRIEERWRWRHEPQQMRDEPHLEKERLRQEEAEQEHRRQMRSQTLTFAQLLEEPLLQGWETHPFLPDWFRTAVVEHIRDTQRELAALGPKPRRPLVRAALKALGQQIYATEAAGGEMLIETDERQDLGDVFEDLIYAAKQPALVDEIVDWLFL